MSDLDDIKADLAAINRHLQRVPDKADWLLGISATFLALVLILIVFA